MILFLVAILIFYLNILLRYFIWLVLLPTILAGFVISLAWPGTRFTVSGVLGRGLATMLVIFAFYALSQYRKKG